MIPLSNVLTPHFHQTPDSEAFNIYGNTCGTISLAKPSGAQRRGKDRREAEKKKKFFYIDVGIQARARKFRVTTPSLGDSGNFQKGETHLID